MAIELEGIGFRTLAGAMAWVMAAGPASADEIVMKSGQVIKGRVVSENVNTVSYERGDQRFYLDKREIAVVETPNPWLVLGAGAFVPGSGQLLLGDVVAAGMVAGTAVAVGGGMYAIARQTGMKNVDNIPLSIGVGAVIWLGGAIAAYLDARAKTEKPKLNIQLDGSVVRNGVGELLAPQK